MRRHTSATLHPATHQLLHTDSSDLVKIFDQVFDLFRQAFLLLFIFTKKIS